MTSILEYIDKNFTIGKPVAILSGLSKNKVNMNFVKAVAARIISY